MSNLNRDNGLDKLTLGFVTVMSVIMLLSLGADLRDRDYFQIAMTGTSILFFLGLGALVINIRWRDLKDRVTAAQRDVENERRLREMDMNRTAAAKVAEVAVPEREFPAELKQLLDEVIMPELKGIALEKAQHDLVRELIDQNGGFPLTEENIPAVEQEFHKITNRYARVRLVEGGKTLDVKFSKEPFTEEPAAGNTAKAAEAPATTKPLTKSQQRRINATKGLGALTDDEVREQRNEKRRQARAAKKATEATPTTTTTTTQPGQLELPVDKK